MIVRSLFYRFGRSIQISCKRSPFSCHLAESRLNFQLSFAQALLLGKGGVWIVIEPGSGRTNRCLKSGSFDQQGDRFSQILARFYRIGTFNEEGETGVIRRRLDLPITCYGGNCAVFKGIGHF